MDKGQLYNLIDSLNEIPRCPLEKLPEIVLKGLNGFLEPDAVILQISYPAMKTAPLRTGDAALQNILSDYAGKFGALGVGSAEFVPDEADNYIITCAQLNKLDGYNCLIAVMVSQSNTNKLLIRQILELYRSNILLALTLQKTTKQTDIQHVITSIIPELKHLGVGGILTVEKNNNGYGVWFENGSSKQVLIGDRLNEAITVDDGSIKSEIQDSVLSLLPTSNKYANLSKCSFELGNTSVSCIFAGEYKREKIVFSKFRSMLLDYTQPTGYGEIVQAFKNLKDDHKLIVKGERVAAILETAVAINHEINNPLTAVLGNTQLLLMQKDTLPEDVISKIATIEKSALRIRQITHKLMSIVEPVTTSYVENLDMLDIDKSAPPEKD